MQRASLDADFLFQTTGAILGFAKQTESPDQTKEIKSIEVKSWHDRSQKDQPSECAILASQISPSVQSFCWEQLTGIMIANLFDNTVQIHAIKSDQDETVASVIRAEIAINPDSASLIVSNGLGHAIETSEALAVGQVLVLSSPEMEFPSSGSAQMKQVLAQLPKAPGVFAQGTQVAADELKFYLLEVARCYQANFADFLFVENMEHAALNAEMWFDRICNTLMSSASLPAKKEVISAMLIEGHWMPVSISLHEPNKIQVVLTIAGESLWPNLFDPPLRARHFVRAKPMETVFPDDCGFQCVAWLTEECAQSRQPSVTLQQAICMRHSFAMRHIHDKTQRNQVDMQLGAANDLQIALGTLLKEHGVPHDKVALRIEAMTNKLGIKQIQDAMTSKRPWAALKALANQCEPRFQIILPAEFEAQREARARDGHQVGSKSNKQSRKPPNMPEPSVVIMAEDVFLPHGVFCIKDGPLLSQLTVSDIAADANGIVLGSESELAPFLQKPCLSSGGLALAVLNPSQAFVNSHGAILRFPVACRSTEEPVIISAVLVQRGKQVVMRNRPEAPPRICEEANAVLKIMVFKDEVANWQTFAQAPIRWIIDQCPPLQICRLVDCSCAKKHMNDPQQDVILDLWGRSFLTHRFHRCPQDQADLFSCHARLEQSTAASMLKLSGVAGIYLEQRSIDGKRDDVAFHTIWLSHKSQGEARADLALAPIGSSLLRIGQRFGIRTPIAKAEEMHQLLRNGQPFLAGTKTLWEIAPLPWGSTKKAIQALVDSWNWRARALQSGGKSRDGTGLVWQIQAIEDPPATVYSLQHSDVVITKLSQAPHVTTKTVMRAEVSKRTQEVLVKGTDPWSEGKDPWASYTKKQQNAAPSHDSTHILQQIRQVEASLEAKVNQKIAEASFAHRQEDVTMEAGLADRVATLETQLAQVQQQQQTQNAATASVSQQVSALAHQFEAHSNAWEKALESTIDRKMTSHMQRLEDLLQKRPRHE